MRIKMPQFSDLVRAMDSPVFSHLSGNLQPGESLSVTLDNVAFAENVSVIFQNAASHLLDDQ